jgi:hypothetical protein
LLGGCLPAIYFSNYYGFKRMKEEQGWLIKWEFMDAAGIEPVTSR